MPITRCHSCSEYTHTGTASDATIPVHNPHYIYAATTEGTEMRMIRWMCGGKITDRFSSSEVREIMNIWYNYNDTVTQVKIVWTCFTKGQE